TTQWEAARVQVRRLTKRLRRTAEPAHAEAADAVQPIEDARTEANRIVGQARRRMDHLARRHDRLAAAVKTHPTKTRRSTAEVDLSRDDGGAAA
ncbi:MAG TPA: hypothetical protein VGX25_15630, partial [Actinophytocola sp.]|uniref:hypothetical protein n=1 Tax=Actinophytocola sp. TaxID=1872138 RepID=UPI002DDD5D5E